MLTQSKLREIFYYDQESGEMIWRARPRSDFQTDRAFNTFNTLRVGRVAGNIDCLDGYRKIGIFGRLYRAHRLVWFYIHGGWPNGEIDHINQCKADNRVSNLRVVSRGENERNKPLRRDNSSGAVGVYQRGSKWRANINAHGKTIRLGTFITKEAAILARKDAEARYGYHCNHGDIPGRVNGTSGNAYLDNYSAG